MAVCSSANDVSLTCQPVRGGSSGQYIDIYICVFFLMFTDCAVCVNDKLGQYQSLSCTGYISYGIVVFLIS